ncbi:MAG: HAD-IA family hydrolase [Candidatus Pacebacteria bacterium]|nr:HAD-IA family hydrolase [Candidatus Paceibacterota bacterium]
MIKSLLSDFSWTILFPKDKNYQGTLNSLHDQLLKKHGPDYQFFDYFRLDQKLLDFYQSLNLDSLNIFTSGQVQNHSQVKKVLKPIFGYIFSAEVLGAGKTDPASFTLVAEKLNLKLKEILFIDDQEKYIEAAKKAGLVTILYRGIKDLKVKIKNLPRSLLR